MNLKLSKQKATTENSNLSQKKKKKTTENLNQIISVQVMPVCSVAKSCLTLCDLMDCSPPGSSVRGIYQARVQRSRLPFPPPGNLPNPGIEPSFPESPVLAGRFFTTEPPGEAPVQIKFSFNISFTVSEIYKFRRHLILSCICTDHTYWE